MPNINNVLASLHMDEVKNILSNTTVNDVVGRLDHPLDQSGNEIPLSAHIYRISDEAFSNLERPVQEMLLQEGYGPSGWMNNNTEFGVLTAMGGKKMDPGYYVVVYQDAAGQTQYAPLSTVLSPEQRSSFVAGAATLLEDLTAGGVPVSGPPELEVAKQLVNQKRETEPRRLQLEGDDKKVPYVVIRASDIPINYSNEMKDLGFHLEYLPETYTSGIYSLTSRGEMKLFWVIRESDLPE